MVNCGHEEMNMISNICNDWLIDWCSPPPTWTVEGRSGPWIHAEGAKFWPFHLCVKWFIRRGYIFPIFVQYRWVCAHCGLGFLFLADRRGTYVVFCSCCSSLCLYRVIIWVIVAFLSEPVWLFFIKLSHQCGADAVCRTITSWMFFIYCYILSKL